MKCSETQLSLAPGELEVCDGPRITSNGPQTRSTSHSSTNGSIITMTLKNNHLIVETEERNVTIKYVYLNLADFIYL